MMRSKTFDILKKKMTKNIRSYHPDCVHHQVFDPVLVKAKQAKNHEYNVEKIGQNGQPHVAQKVENLSLKS